MANLQAMAGKEPGSPSYSHKEMNCDNNPNGHEGNPCPNRLPDENTAQPMARVQLFKILGREPANLCPDS